LDLSGEGGLLVLILGRLDGLKIVGRKVSRCVVGAIFRLMVPKHHLLLLALAEQLSRVRANFPAMLIVVVRLLVVARLITRAAARPDHHLVSLLSYNPWVVLKGGRLLEQGLGQLHMSRRR